MYPRFITGTKSVLRSWMLTSRPTPFSPCKTFSSEGCPEIQKLQHMRTEIFGCMTTRFIQEPWPETCCGLQFHPAQLPSQGPFTLSKQTTTTAKTTVYVSFVDHSLLHKCFFQIVESNTRIPHGRDHDSADSNTISPSDF